MKGTKEASPHTTLTAHHSPSPLVVLTCIQFPPAHPKGQETWCQGAGASELSKWAPPEARRSRAATCLPMTVSTCVKTTM